MLNASASRAAKQGDTDSPFLQSAYPTMRRNHPLALSQVGERLSAEVHAMTDEERERQGPSANLLRQLLDYDPLTGVFRWRRNMSGFARAGSIAGELRSIGYRYIRVQNVAYPAHRLAWLYVHGELPRQHIDHINGDRADNRIANLRDVSRAVNAQNQRSASSKSRSGFLGVYWRYGAWRACIRANGKSQYFGPFATPEEAHEAYIHAKRILHEGCTL